MAAPRLLVPGAADAGTLVHLPADEAHHLVRVLRARVGDEVRLFDGRGREWLARIATLGRAAATVGIVREVTPAAEPHVKITLAIGLLKGDHMDAVVRDATMLGVAAILPMVTTHVSVPARAWKSGAARERWRRVAIASAKQSGRAVVPQVGAVTPFRDVLARTPEVPTFMCVEPAMAGNASARTLPAAPPASALVLVGPEGGWSAGEVEQATAAGAAVLSLGPRTLRAESAPIVALTALWTRWDW